jgi:mono/diheme cytochrome c family protein
MRSSRSTTVLGVLAAMVAVSACGGGGDAEPAASATPAAEPAVAAATGAVNMDSIGRVVYATCTTCHQQNGEGLAGSFPPLAGSSIATGAPEIPIAIVLHGMQGPLTVKGVEYNGVMTPWGPMFDDLQIAAVLTYVRSQWGNSASAVTPEQVARVRAATSSRTTMWTWEELQKATF